MEKAIKNNKKTNIIFIIGISAMVLACLYFVLDFLGVIDNIFAPRTPLTCKEVTIEAGGEFDPWDYLADKEAASVNQIKAISDVNTSVPGDYKVSYSDPNWRRYNELNVHVVDTIYPTVSVNDVLVFPSDQTISTEDLISECNDATALTISMNYADVDLTVAGEYDVEIYVTDLGNNTTTVNAHVIISEPDYEAPVISGVENVVIDAGTAVDYLANVTVSDNIDPEPAISVDFKDFDVNVEGEYEIEYIATDKSGNITIVPCLITVIGNAYQGITSSGSASSQILGLTRHEMYVGSTFDPYWGVSLAPEYFAPGTEIMVELGTFNQNVTGTYSILYGAVDINGELVLASRTVIVKNQPYYFKPEGTTYSFDAAGISGQPYIVLVNRAMCCVTVYGLDDEGHYTVPVKAFACSIGREGHETPTGRYVTSGRYDWCLMVDGSWGRNAITVYKGIMFHTVCYYTKSIDDLEYEEFNKLGTPASLGCIRLCYADETWIYENCPNGFTTIIYDDYTSPGPLGKPETILIDVNDEEARGWDPTDPENPYASNYSFEEN